MISILLSTYNSEKYLKEQIDSILSQTYKNWTLIIRDDGSSDNTISIINLYTEKYVNILHFKDDLTNLGAKNSFIKLLENTSSEYYMFCDHDDIWLPDKIKLTLDLFLKTEEKYKGKPILIFTDLCLVDSNLNIVNKSMWKFQKANPENAKNIYYLSISNPVTGCTMMINNKAKEISLPMSQKAIMHDLWIAMNISNFGISYYLNVPTVLYRQHGENLIGAKNVDCKYYLNRLLNLRTTILDNIKLIKMMNSLNFKINYYKWVLLKIKFLLGKKNKENFTL